MANNASHSIIIRLELSNQSRMLSTVTQVIGDLGATINDIDLVEAKKRPIYEILGFLLIVMIILNA